MSISDRVKETLQTIDIGGREQPLHRCDTCGESLDPATDATVGYECTTCGAVLAERPQVCPQCTRYLFERIDLPAHKAVDFIH